VRILVIEDEPRILDFLTRGLEAAGFNVEGARDGPAGLQRALYERWDLVILDLLLPGLDGMTVLRRIQAQAAELPVVVVSARDDLPTKLEGFSLGASDFVCKPFSFAELLARVRVHVAKTSPAAPSSSVALGGLVLDVARRQATLGDHVADLSEREFRLLHHLAEHCGEVVSRTSLLSEVWGYHFDPGSNVVDVCIRRLRLKLGPDAPIETVRHAGYRLTAV
jgi:two-component system, OmpR family, response regulator